MELITDRCLIRNLNIDDTDELYQMLSDEGVMRYIEPVFDMNKNYWGQGIADEVTRKLVEYAKCLGADSCVIECDAEQIASKRIAQKNGFVYEGKSDDLECYRLVL